MSGMEITVLSGAPWTRTTIWSSFSHALWGRSMGGEWSCHPHREPMLLLYLLPLSRHASSQTPTDPKASAFPVSPIPHPSYAHHVTPNTLPLAIPTQPPVIIHPRWPFSRPAGYILPVRLSSRFTCCTLISRFKKKKKPVAEPVAAGVDIQEVEFDETTWFELVLGCKLSSV